MPTLIPVLSLTPSTIEGPETSGCPICRRTFADEGDKRHHLDQAHPDWALQMMSRWLSCVPRENG